MDLETSYLLQTKEKNENMLYKLFATMDKNYSRIELLAIIKAFNKGNSDKIKNADKMKKEDLINLCNSYSLINDESADITSKHIDLHNLSRNSLLQDISLYFIKQGKHVPSDILAMKKNDLIDFMETNEIIHYTPELIEIETKKYIAEDNAKKIIHYNMIRYDNVNTEDIDNNNLVGYVESQELDQEMKHFNSYAKMLSAIYTAYDKFCEETSCEKQNDKIKSFPKVIQHLTKVIE